MSHVHTQRFYSLFFENIVRITLIGTIILRFKYLYSYYILHCRQIISTPVIIIFTNKYFRPVRMTAAAVKTIIIIMNVCVEKRCTKQTVKKYI